MDSGFTYVVYKHAAVRVDRSNAHRHQVVAEAAIANGSVLLVEHVLVQSCAAAAIAVDAQLSAALYPRTHLDSSHAPAPDAAWMEAAKAKELHNSFRSTLGPAYASVGCALSAVNHACRPNAQTCITPILSDDAQLSGEFIVMYAIQDIPNGAEVVISYGPAAGHGHPTFSWDCDCGMTDAQRTAQWDCVNAEVDARAKAAQRFVHPLLARYMLKDECLERWVRNSMAMAGWVSAAAAADFCLPSFAAHFHAATEELRGEMSEEHLKLQAAFADVLDRCRVLLALGAQAFTGRSA
jgi:hypothetical protein